MPTASAAAPTLIDYAMRQIPAQDIRAAGHSGVINYVSTSRPGSSFGAKPITQLALSGKISCATKKKKGRKASTSAKKKKVRRLWGDGKGRFRTSGKYSAATVRGTKWLTEDRCSGTLIRVRRGRVSVRDFVKRKTVLVKQGRVYVARPKKK